MYICTYVYVYVTEKVTQKSNMFAADADDALQGVMRTGIRQPLRVLSNNTL